jgi:hypothetical protein
MLKGVKNNRKAKGAINLGNGRPKSFTKSAAKTKNREGGFMQWLKSNRSKPAFPARKPPLNKRWNSLTILWKHKIPLRLENHFLFPPFICIFEPWKQL